MVVICGVEIGVCDNSGAVETDDFLSSDLPLSVLLDADSIDDIVSTGLCLTGIDDVAVAEAKVGATLVALARNELLVSRRRLGPSLTLG
jgi:hypothetical protein